MPELSRIVSWEEDGLSFTIHDRASFDLEVIPKYFGLHGHGHKNFTRQMGNYEFHRVRNETRIDTFSHPLFFKGSCAVMRTVERTNNGIHDDADAEMAALRVELRTNELNGSALKAIEADAVRIQMDLQKEEIQLMQRNISAMTVQMEAQAAFIEFQRRRIEDLEAENECFIGREMDVSSLAGMLEASADTPALGLEVDEEN